MEIEPFLKTSILPSNIVFHWGMQEFCRKSKNLATFVIQMDWDREKIDWGEIVKDFGREKEMQISIKER